MKTKTKRTVGAVLTVVLHTVVTAEDLLDPVHVEGSASSPAVTPIDTYLLPIARDTADALRDLPGVSGSRMGGHGTDLTIRGQSQTRLNILLDGAYVHGGCPNRMDPPTSYAPAGTYEEITVIKGMQTLEYGGGGAGGTVLFERKTARFDADERVRASVDIGYRGNNDAWDGSVDVAGGSPQGFARFIGSYVDADNYKDGSGIEVRSAYRERSGTVIFGYTPSGDTRVEVSFERQETRDLLFPGAGMDSPLADNDTLRLRYQTTATYGPLSNLRAEIYRSDVEHVMDNYTLRTPGAMLMRAPSTSDTVGGRVVAEMESSIGAWKVGVDVQNNSRDAQRFNDTAIFGTLNSVLWPGVDIAQAGVFAELTHALNDRNRLIAGARYDRVTAEADKADIDPPGGALSPNALYAIYYNGARATKQTENNVGALLRVEHDLANSDAALYAAVSRAVRTADATERFLGSNGSTPSRRWVGNPLLDPEKHHQLELGLQVRGDSWTAEASAYYNDVSDYILRDRFTGTLPTPGNATIYRNIDATLIGGEISLRRHWTANWSSELGLAYVRAENDTDNRPIAQTPPLEGIVTLDFHSGRWNAGARLRAAAKQTRVDTESSAGGGIGLDVRKTPGWGALDLHGSYAFGENLQIDVGVDNLFDKDYAQHLNRESAFDPTQVQVDEPGRSAWIKVSGEF